MPEARLASVILPEELGLRRDLVAPARERQEGYEERYDHLTLVYDAVGFPDEGLVRLFCPKLLNLEREIRAAAMRIGGRPAPIARIRRFERYDMVEVAAPEPAGELSIGLRGWEARVAVSPQDRTSFAGRNVLLTLSRNNDLRWIADWVRFHVREHGADAVLFFDNDSSGYGLPEIEAMLAGVEGIGRVVVLSAPFLYGPQGLGRTKFRANFLQAGLLNLARLRFLGPARAVLQCDVDELVVRRGSETVFDATVASRTGFLRIRGEWRFPAPADRMALHLDHYMLGAAPKTCPPKYCIVPEGPMRRKSWATHGLAGVPFGFRFISDRFRFLHCYGISDFWKGRPATAAAAAGRVDEASRELLAGVLG